jgi:hypothetical protein
MDAVSLYQELVNKQLEALIDSLVSIAVDDFLKTDGVLFREVLPVVFWSFEEVPHVNTSVFE